jgi:hypothetical protein
MRECVLRDHASREDVQHEHLLHEYFLHGVVVHEPPRIAVAARDNTRHSTALRQE